MGKPYEVTVPSSKLSLLHISLLAFFMSMQLCTTANAADFEFTPRVSVKAEYNDNVEEVKSGKGDYLGIIKPGFNAHYEHARVLFDVSYDFEYKKYMNQVLADEDNHNLNALLNVEAIKDLFYVEVYDRYRKVFTDVTRGDVPEGDTSTGTTDQNLFGLKPYFVIPIQDRTRLNLGGELKDYWYSREESIDKTNLRLFADVDHELSDVWELTVGAAWEKQDPERGDGGFQRYSGKLGTTYAYAENSFVGVTLEPTYTDFEAEGSNKQYNPYRLEVQHAFSDTIVLSASTAMEFTENPQSAATRNRYIHSIGIAKEYDRGKVNLSLAYNDYESGDTTARSTYWRPTLGGDHELTDRLGLRYYLYADLNTNPDTDKYFFTLVSLRYSISERISSSLSYRFKNRDNERSATDFVSNTIGLSLDWSM